MNHYALQLKAAMCSKGVLVGVNGIGALVGLTGLGFNIASISVDCIYDQHDVSVYLQMHTPFLKTQCARWTGIVGLVFSALGVAAAFSGGPWPDDIGCRCVLQVMKSWGLVLGFVGLGFDIANVCIDCIFDEERIISYLDNTQSDLTVSCLEWVNIVGLILSIVGIVVSFIGGLGSLGKEHEGASPGVQLA